MEFIRDELTDAQKRSLEAQGIHAESKSELKRELKRIEDETEAKRGYRPNLELKDIREAIKETDAPTEAIISPHYAKDKSLHEEVAKVMDAHSAREARKRLEARLEALVERLLEK
jgi:hypothetical protein